MLVFKNTARHVFSFLTSGSFQSPASDGRAVDKTKHGYQVPEHRGRFGESKLYGLRAVLRTGGIGVLACWRVIRCLVLLIIMSFPFWYRILFNHAHLMALWSLIPKTM